PAGVHAHGPWLAGGVPVDNVHEPQRHAELLGDDHGQYRLRSLADLAGPGDERNFPEIVQLEDGPAAVGAVDARPSAHVKHGCIAHAALPAGAGWAGHRLAHLSLDGV